MASRRAFIQGGAAVLPAMAAMGVREARAETKVLKGGRKLTVLARLG